MKNDIPDTAYIDNLRALVAKHQHKYHTEDAPEISDEAYDALVRELVALEKHFKLKSSTVSQAVGAAPSSAFSKVIHTARQWSFDNVFNLTELTQWEERLERYLAKEGLVSKNIAYVCEHKIDGLKLVMQYKAGVLVQALTRGDGVTGEDVTHTAKTIITTRIAPSTGRA